MFLHPVKYFGKDSTNISRVILCGPYCPVAHLAPVSPSRKNRFAINHFTNVFVVGEAGDVSLDGVDVENVLLIRL